MMSGDDGGGGGGWTDWMSQSESGSGVIGGREKWPYKGWRRTPAMTGRRSTPPVRLSYFLRILASPV
uniref:Uncharacterized protein n=1 Tax=Oryza meridionalis TaxID=40149 RepID=A0A0E0D1Y1_9ORYZ